MITKFSNKSKILPGILSIRPRKKIKRLSQLLTQSIESQLYQKFESIMDTKRKEYLKSRLNHYYGKNFPVNYKKHYAFEEQWEGKEINEDRNDQQFLRKSNPIRISILLIRLVLYILTIWFSNIEFFIRQADRRPSYNLIFSLSLASEVTNVVLIIWQKQRTMVQMSRLSILRCVMKNIMLIVHLILKLSNIQIKQSAEWTLIEIVFIYLTYGEASCIYQTIRLMSFAIHYEYQSKLFDLLATLIIIAHFVAIILHLSIKIGDYDINWQSNLDIDKSNEFILYLYAFYFGSTTILTVGYGDISPKNPAEVGIIILIEIFGIVMFAYIINEIGYSISSLRKERELVERDLSTMEKIKKHYHMNEKLTQRARSYLINHKPNVHKLVPEQENSLLMKFNEQLRNQITNNNMKMVVKSSLFFIIRWSKSFQCAFANKLTHVLFSPNDLLYQPQGKERIYLLRSGKFNIYGKVNGSKKMKNLLKTLECSIDKQISDNCYGYTSAISSKPARLYAIAQNFVSCYFVEKDRFCECIEQRLGDFQFYHELKDRIELSACKQAIEVPACQSSKNHFNPTKATIIRKYTKSRQYNKRKDYTRYKRESFRGQKVLLDSAMFKYVSNRFTSGDCRTLENIEKGTNEEIYFLKEPARARKDTSNTMESEHEFVYLKNLVMHVMNDFQEAKEYTNYFSKSNITRILLRYENEEFGTKKYGKFMNENNSVIKSYFLSREQRTITIF